MSQYNPNLNHAALAARVQARRTEAERHRLVRDRSRRHASHSVPSSRSLVRRSRATA